jgi:1,4-dihydroxy-2-naphthoate octaprenyltransferase
MVRAYLRPVHTLLLALAYLLGASLARYLGADFLFLPFLLGFLWLSFLLTAANLLDAAYRNSLQPYQPDETPRQRDEYRRKLVLLAVSLLVLVAALAVPMLALSMTAPASLALMALSVLIALAYAVPPLRLANRGLGEFALALLIASLTPALAFSLQTGELHRLLTFYVFPLFFLILACLLSLNFPNFASDQKYLRQTLLLRLGWQAAIPVHNAFLVAAYLLLAIAPFIGVPFDLAWPGLLSIPLAAFQIYQFQRMADGGKPLWPLIQALAISIPTLTAYLLILTLWLR